MSYTVNPATAAAACCWVSATTRGAGADDVVGRRTGEGLHFDARGPRGLRLRPDVHRLALLVQAQRHLHPAAGCVSPGDCRRRVRRGART